VVGISAARFPDPDDGVYDATEVEVLDWVATTVTGVKGIAKGDVVEWVGITVTGV